MTERQCVNQLNGGIRGGRAALWSIGGIPIREGKFIKNNMTGCYDFPSLQVEAPVAFVFSGITKKYTGSRPRA